MNQARSSFAHGVLTKTYPELDVSSCGVDAVDGLMYLPEVVKIAHRWGIDMNVGFSRKPSSESIESSDLIICAETWMLGAIETFKAKGKKLSYESVVPDSTFMPQDPEGLRGRFLEAELAKVAWINLQAVRLYISEIPLYPIIAVVPETEKMLDAALDLAISECKRISGQLIDADLRAPIFRELESRNIITHQLMPEDRDFETGNGEIKDGAAFSAYSGMRDYLTPEENLLEPMWAQFVTNIAQIRPVVLVTSPQQIPLGPLPDSYLACIPATRVIVVK